MIRTISRWVAATTVCAGLSVAVSQAIVWGVPSCPHGHSALCRASCRHVGSVTLPIVLGELSAVRKGPMIVSIPSTARPQQRYDHRLRHLVQRTGDMTVATDLGIPRSTACGWLGAAPTVVGLSECGGPHGAGASDRRS
jgi:hypothetical protein